MKWPNEIEIGALIYKVYYIKPGGKNSKKLGDKESGSVTQYTQEIYIDKDLPPGLKFLVLMHEIVHAIGDAIDPNGPPFTNEKYTNPFSNLIIQSMRSAGFLKEGL